MLQTRTIHAMLASAALAPLDLDLRTRRLPLARDDSDFGLFDSACAAAPGSEPAGGRDREHDARGERRQEQHGAVGRSCSIPDAQDIEHGRRINRSRRREQPGFADERGSICARLKTAVTCLALGLVRLRSAQTKVAETKA